MKKIIAILVMLVSMVVAVPMFAENKIDSGWMIVNANGIWWNQMNNGEKISFVLGSMQTAYYSNKADGGFSSENFAMELMTDDDLAWIIMYVNNFYSSSTKVADNWDKPVAIVLAMAFQEYYNKLYGGVKKGA